MKLELTRLPSLTAHTPALSTGGHARTPLAVEHELSHTNCHR